jgi:hypothetical protein
MIHIQDWGPAGWTFLHAIANTYSETPSIREQRIYRSFFESIADVMPCSICGEHFRGFLPAPVESRGALSTWLIGVHNAVRKKQGKRQLSMSEACAAIRQRGKQTCLNFKYVALWVVVSIVFLISVVMYVRRGST